MLLQPPFPGVSDSYKCARLHIDDYNTRHLRAWYFCCRAKPYVHKNTRIQHRPSDWQTDDCSHSISFHNEIVTTPVLGKYLLINNRIV